MFAVTGPVTSSTSAWRGHEAQAEALEVVDDVVQRVDLELAAIARAGVHLADGKRAPEPRPRGAIDARRELGEGGFIGRRRRLGERPAQKVPDEDAVHLQVVAGVRAVER